MRWQFIDPRNDSETAESGIVIAKIDAWWHEFQNKTKEITALFSREAEWDLPGWMELYLQSIDPNLMWEFGPAVRRPGHRLVITPESEHHLRPLVRTILKRAPELTGWEFYEYRLAEDFESTRLNVEGRTGCDIASFQFRASRSERNLIDLSFASPAVDDQDEQTRFNAAFIATESLLGEQCLDNWVGGIEITSLPAETGLKSLFGSGKTKRPMLVGLDRMNATANALIESIREQLPRDPHYMWVDDAQWSIWELKPESADDYCEQKDLFVGKSANPSQWKAAHSGGLFCSERFSRCEETFCYVKIDGSSGLDEEGFADKSEIEDALNAVLKAERIGCYIGGGSGLRYSYVDLALTAIDKGIDVVRQRLQLGKVPKRSWIQFYDSDLAAEWVGVYDDSPCPPLEFDC